MAVGRRQGSVRGTIRVPWSRMVTRMSDLSGDGFCTSSTESKHRPSLPQGLVRSSIMEILLASHRTFNSHLQPSRPQPKIQPQPQTHQTHHHQSQKETPPLHLLPPPQILKRRATLNITTLPPRCHRRNCMRHRRRSISTLLEIFSIGDDFFRDDWLGWKRSRSGHGA